MKGHTTARVGKRINVVLKHGGRFVDKLKEDKSQYFVFERQGRVPKEHIRSFSINRGATRDG
jgi:hypothetical protein